MTAAKRPKTPPRNVDDVDYVATNETKPMREVLRERHAKAKTVSKKLLADAFRERAGMIGLLQSCLCAFPLVEASTDSKHEQWCPSHQLFLSKQIVNDRKRKGQHDGT
jgi:hypothetical protein